MNTCLEMYRKCKNKYNILPKQVKVSIWFLICGFFQKGISIITTPIFTRLLTTSEFGEFSVFNSWLGILSIFISLNLCYGVFAQGLVKFEDDQNKFTSSLQGLTLFLMVLWFFIYLSFRTFWNNLFSMSTLQMTSLFSIIWTTSIFNFWSMSERVRLSYEKLIIITVLVSIAKPLFGIIVVLFAKDKVTARILELALVEIIAYFGLFVILMMKGKCFYSKKYWRYALKFNIPLIPHYLSMTVLNTSDRLMIGKLCGLSQTGIYNLAYSISQIMIIFNTAFMQTLEPVLYKKIKEKKFHELMNLVLPSILVISIVNILLIAFTPEIISIFAPKIYYEAIWVIPPIAMSVYFMLLYNFFAVFEFYFEKTKYITLATSGGAIVNIVLNYIFINIFGYLAAGYTTLICYMIFAILHYKFMNLICKEQLGGIKPYNIRPIIVTSAIFICSGFILMLTYRNNVVRYSIILFLLIVMVICRKNLKSIYQKLKNVKKER